MSAADEIQDDERLMTLRGDIAQAIARGRAAGADPADVVACTAFAFGEAMAATGAADLTDAAYSFLRGAQRAFLDARARRQAEIAAREAEAPAIYRSGSARRRR